MSKNKYQLHSAEVALQMLDLIPRPSGLFSTCIRTIKQAELNSPDASAARAASVQAANFLVSVSPTLRATLYFAAETLHPEGLIAIKEINHKKLLELFSPSEIAALLGVTYLYRQVKNKVDYEEWSRLSPKLLAHMEIGALVGDTVNHIGPGNGILLGAFRFLSLGMFAIKDLKAFKDYRRKLEKKNRLFDLHEEESRFGCTHLQVASALCTVLGYGLTVSLGFGFDESSEEFQGLSDRQAEEVMCWRVARAMTESYHNTGESGDGGADGELALPPEEQKILNEKIASIRDSGSSIGWFSASAEQAPPEVQEGLKLIRKEDSTSAPELEDEALKGEHTEASEGAAKQ